ncbi:MAG: hypothetical protein WCO71_11885, partial [Pseudomonadota bacterium]
MQNRHAEDKAKSAVNKKYSFLLIILCQELLFVLFEPNQRECATPTPSGVGLSVRHFVCAGLFYASQWDETDFDTPLKRGGYTIKHRQRVACVVGVLQSADRRRARSHQLRQFAL